MEIVHENTIKTYFQNNILQGKFLALFGIFLNLFRSFLGLFSNRDKYLNWQVMLKNKNKLNLLILNRQWYNETKQLPVIARVGRSIKIFSKKHNKVINIKLYHKAIIN